VKLSVASNVEYKDCKGSSSTCSCVVMTWWSSKLTALQLRD